MKLSKEVALFAKAMQYKLNKSKHKPGWIAYDLKGKRVYDGKMIEFLFSKLVEESSELAREVSIFKSFRKVYKYFDSSKQKKDGFPRILLEAADVGNIAMMIADACNQLIISNSRTVKSR